MATTALSLLPEIHTLLSWKNIQHFNR